MMGVGAVSVYKLMPAGEKIVLHSFTGGADGGLPYADVAMDAARYWSIS